MADWRSAWKHLDRLPEVARCLARCRRPMRTILLYLRVTRWPGPLRLGLRNGVRIVVREYEDLVTVWTVFFRREYHVPDAAATILDLGANIGCFTLLAAVERPGARIIAVEPYPPTIVLLEESLRLNAAMGERVSIWHFGVGGQSGSRLIPDATAPSQSLGMVAAGAEAGLRGTTIEVKSLDEILVQACAELVVDEIDFMKMDVEGAEHEALRAVTRSGLRRVKALGMEYHPNDDTQGLFEAIRRHGFDLVHDHPINEGAGIAHFRRIE